MSVSRYTSRSFIYELFLFSRAVFCPISRFFIYRELLIADRFLQSKAHHFFENKKETAYAISLGVEMKGFEPLTPCLQGRCSPN